MSIHSAGAQRRQALASGGDAFGVKTGYRLQLDKADVWYYAATNSGAIALTCPPFDRQPPGLTFVLDNSLNDAAMTLTPDTGSVITVDANDVVQVYITAAESALANELS